MYARVWNYLRGSILLQCDSPAPERILNLCAAYGIPFWDVQWETAERFTVRTTRAGARRLEQAAAEAGAVLRRLREQGAPVAFRRIRRRYVLWGTLALMLVLFWYGSTCIWDFQVTGNDTIPTEKILRALERNGVAVGTRTLSFRQEQLRNRVLLELDDISWLSVNVRGCTAYVQVVERKRPPEIIDRTDSANIVAARDGLITEVEALDGRALVKKGETVQAGQLLISGVSDGRFGGVRFMRSLGRVYARTWYTLSARIPLTAVEKTAASDTHTTGVSLDMGKKRIKIFGGGSMLGVGCDKITVYHPLTLPFGLRLPLTLVTEEIVSHAVQTVQRTEAAAQAEGEAALLRQLEERLTDGGTVTATHFSAQRQGDILLVTLVAECSEQIGVSVPLQVSPAA